MKLQLVVGNLRLSSWSIRPYLALLHSGLPHTLQVVRLGEPDTRARLAALSPSGRVPLLEIDGHRVWDSLAITETLAELAPQLWPRDRFARAMARSACAEMHAGFADLRREASMELFAKKPIASPSPALLADIARLEQLFADCRAAYGQGGPYLFGDFSAADCFFVPVMTRFDAYALPMQAPTRAYFEALRAAPAVQRWLEQAAQEPAPPPTH